MRLNAWEREKLDRWLSDPVPVSYSTPESLAHIILMDDDARRRRELKIRCELHLRDLRQEANQIYGQ